MRIIIPAWIDGHNCFGHHIFLISDFVLKTSVKNGQHCVFFFFVLKTFQIYEHSKRWTNNDDRMQRIAQNHNDTSDRSQMTNCAYRLESDPIRIWTGTSICWCMLWPIRLPFFRRIYYLFKTERSAHNSKWIVYSGERYTFLYLKISLSLEFHVLLWQVNGVNLLENRTAVSLASVLNLLLRRTRTFDWMDLPLVRLRVDNDRRLWPRLTLRRIVGICIYIHV